MAVLALVLAAYFRGAGAGGSGPQALIGKPAASFTVPGANGGTGGVREYRGKIVVLNLWASWCPPCRAEMPDLQRLYGTYRGRGVVVLGVDQGESRRQAASFARSLGIEYPILLDRDQQYGRIYAALGLPTTAIVDRTGTVVDAFDGPLSYPQMAQALAPLLHGPS